jgi:hypothetical protein
MKINGELARDRLSNELGFEADRARELSSGAIIDEIAIFWQESELPQIADENYVTMANASLSSGTIGKQKLSELVSRNLGKQSAKLSVTEITAKISIIATRYQSLLNLSRNRGVYINAHLNLLEPERTMRRIYAPYISEIDIKKFQARAFMLLKEQISSEKSLRKWLGEVHDLLDKICITAALDINNVNGSNLVGGVKGIISKKAIPTYFKQWEIYVLETIGPEFGVPLRELSPLSRRLNELEKNKKRSWTTIVQEITEAEKSGSIKKIMDSTTEKLRNNEVSKDLLKHKFPIGKDKKSLSIEISSSKLNQEIINQFIKSAKAQMAIYEGEGVFETSMNYQGVVINLSLPDATKADLITIEKYLTSMMN